MSARPSAAFALVAVLALLLAPPASGGPLRKALRLAVRQARHALEVRRTVERVRVWHELERARAWPTVRADGSSTAPPAPRVDRPRPAPADRPRGTRR